VNCCYISLYLIRPNATVKCYKFTHIQTFFNFELNFNLGINASVSL